MGFEFGMVRDFRENQTRKCIFPVPPFHAIHVGWCMRTSIENKGGLGLTNAYKPNIYKLQAQRAKIWRNKAKRRAT